MEVSQIEFTIAWVSILGTTLGCVFAAFGFLHREMRRGFDRVDKRFDGVDKRFDGIDEKVDEKVEGLRTAVASLDVRVARIEGHLGIGVPSSVEPRAAGGPPERAA